MDMSICKSPSRIRENVGFRQYVSKSMSETTVSGNVLLRCTFRKMEVSEKLTHVVQGTSDTHKSLSPPLDFSLRIFVSISLNRK